MANVTRSSQALGTGRPKDDSENLNPQALLDGIQKTLCQGASEVLFSVGGKINLTNDTPPDAIHGKRDPVRIYWTSGAGENHPRMMSFPTTEPRVATTEPLAQLLKDCEPATFGRGNQEVLDEDYRQASKMDVQRFASDYSPYENRVMEKVSQALAFRDVGHNSHRGLWAELYKLNIYSAPSGKFKAHVDTPRSKDQMGSLVVCLPTPHEGGELTIRRQGRQNVYSWGALSASHIQWAAFYSDEEHQVGKVTKGHRVTLTYNLYWASCGPTTVDSLIGDDLGLLSWVAKLDELSKCKEYLEDLGALGFHTIQHYPHSASGAARGDIEEQLKGFDMLVFQAFKRLGGDVKVTAVIDDREYQDRDSFGYDSRDRENDPGDGRYFVAEHLHSPKLENQCSEEEEWPSPREFWPYSSQKVTWLNGEPTEGTELAVAAIVTGNEPSLLAFYTKAVILARFPRSVAR